MPFSLDVILDLSLHDPKQKGWRLTVNLLKYQAVVEGSASLASSLFAQCVLSYPCFSSGQVFKEKFVLLSFLDLGFHFLKIFS